MTGSTRRSVLAAVGVSLTTAGCVSKLRGGETTENWVEQASNEPEPDHRITLNNDSDETRTVRVRVVRAATDETVFEDTREISAGSEIVAYNLKQADPDGVEAFRVCGQLVEADGATATTASEESEIRHCATVETSECYGSTHVTVQKDGSLQVIYAIC